MLSEITPRMLDRWVIEGVITPSVQSSSGSGVDRIFNFRDVVGVALVARLRALGVSLDRTRLSLERLFEADVEALDDRGADYLAYFSGGDVLIVKPNEVGSALEERRGEEVVLVDLGDIVSSVRAASMELSLGRPASNTRKPRKVTPRSGGRKSRRE